MNLYMPLLGLLHRLLGSKSPRPVEVNTEPLPKTFESEIEALDREFDWRMKDLRQDNYLRSRDVAVLHYENARDLYIWRQLEIERITEKYGMIPPKEQLEGSNKLWMRNCPQCGEGLGFSADTPYITCPSCKTPLRVIVHVGDHKIQAADLLIRRQDKKEVNDYYDPDLSP